MIRQLTAGSLRAAMPSRLGEMTAFSCFSFAWAFQMLEEKSDRLKPEFFTELPLVACAVLVLFLPRSAWLFAVFCGLQILNFVEELPYTVNHYFLITFANLAWLIAFLRPRRSGDARAGDVALEAATPAIRWMVVAVYLLAGFHKLNTGYLDTEASCFVDAYERLRETLWLLPRLSAEAADFGIYASLALELGLPVLLLVGRTRAAALVAGSLFHLFLGLRHPSFQTMMFALYLLFVPPSFRAVAGRALAERFGNVRWWPVSSIAVATSVVLWYATPLYTSSAYEAARLHELTWFVCFALIVGAVAFGASQISLGRLADPLRMRVTPVQALLVTLLCLNGLSPYLGLKTTTSFSMYSNLRVEEVSNHLLVPEGALRIWDDQDRVIEVIESSEPGLLGAGGLRTTRFELRRRVAELTREGAPGPSITYVLDGRRYHAADAFVDGNLGRAPGWVERKLRHFRGVPPIGDDRCQW